MRKLAQWIARHRKLASVSSLSFWFTLIFIVILADGIIWPVLIISMFGIFATTVVINGAPVESIKQEAEAFMNHCDPYPLIEAIPELLKYQHLEWMEIALERDYCNALNESGQYQDAFDRLRNINIDKSPATLPATKVLYYVSLYESCIGLGMNEQAEMWYQKAISIYRDMKEDKFKKQLETSMSMTIAGYELMHGNVEQAMALHDKSVETTMLERVVRRFLLGRILLKQGKTDEARSALEYVVGNGNKLHIVTLANDLLKTI